MSMKTLPLLLFVWIALSPAQSIHSPGNILTLTFDLTADGQPVYSLQFRNRQVIKQSTLGIELKGEPSLDKGFVISSVDSFVHDETWEPPWGEEKRIRNHYRQLTVTLHQPGPRDRTLVLSFRLFDDGLGFRYEFPRQEHLKYFIISDERTTFTLSGDHTAFWIPGDYDTNEYIYTTSPLSKIDATIGHAADEIFAKTPIARNAVQTPLMMKSVDGLYINIHEAALIDYPAMNLLVDQTLYILKAHLVPDAVGNKAYLQTPARTPWRTIIVSDNAKSILQSRLILNLNDPTKIEDISWIKPQKYIGLWWELHVGKSTWNYADTDNVKLTDTDWSTLKPNGRHGATTTRVKRYIDFAATHGFDAVLVEGWNVGWEDWFGRWKEEVFDFVTPYPDFDVAALQAYAAQKGVKLMMHHETSSSVTNYERRMDEAYRFMKRYGYETVKTGYVGRIIPRGEHHDGQWMVNHYVRVAEKTAQYRLMVNMHEPVRPTGLQRTFPNWLACEAARGNEFNAWSHGNPPEHETILPFTRLMGGPMDYTPGIFQIKMDYYRPGRTEQVHTTLVKQLALYVTMYSPLQMAADLPENYERFPDAFQFIKDVAVDWDRTEILEAEPGDYLTIARKAKGKDEWFIGAITDENARTTTVALDFLPERTSFAATLYTDAPNAHWKTNPMVYQVQTFIVSRRTRLTLRLAPGGGAAVGLKIASPDDLRRWKVYGR
jgi:hypothetical protein